MHIFLRIIVKFCVFILFMKCYRYHYKIEHIVNEIQIRVIRFFLQKLIHFLKDFSIVRKVRVAIVLLLRYDKMKFCMSLT